VATIVSEKARSRARRRTANLRSWSRRSIKQRYGFGGAVVRCS
jgi:hypothetical protein